MLNYNKDLADAPNLPTIGSNEADPVVWGKHYPRHYDSYQKI